MKISPSRLRESIYRILDRVLKTGRPVEIERKGKILKIVAVDRPDRLASLEKRPSAVVGDLEEFVHLDWSKAWRP